MLTLAVAHTGIIGFAASEQASEQVPDGPDGSLVLVGAARRTCAPPGTPSRRTAPGRRSQGCGISRFTVPESADGRRRFACAGRRRGGGDRRDGVGGGTPWLLAV
ncbi:MAG TPA: hypothetical protein VIU15_32910, partial [Streptomyces sp.]